MLTRRITTADSLLITVLMAMAAAASPALAETHPFLYGVGSFSAPNGIVISGTVCAVIMAMTNATPALAETHPFVTSFGSFSNPNGIAVDESNGDVYVADLGTDTISKFDASGTPVNFTCGAPCSTYVAGNQLAGTPSGPFAFPNERGNPAAISIDNSKDPSDPSAGDLYVLDAGHEVIDKFTTNGEALTPITGPFAFPPVGVAVDADGKVHVDVRAGNPRKLATEVFDASAVNNFVELVTQPTVWEAVESQLLGTQQYGFTTDSRSGDAYPLLSCGCVGKLGPHGEELGRVDAGTTAVATAVDPVTGHVYVDDQSVLTHTVSEWDTGEMNGTAAPEPNTNEATGMLLSSFGALQLAGSAEQGGIAVDGTTGDVYVSNPADGKVYMFGTSTPVVTSGTVIDVTSDGATLQGTVDPRGVSVASCRFEYGTDASNDLRLPVGVLEHSVPCATVHGEPVGAGTVPVVVHALVSDLQPGSLYHFRLVATNANGTSHSGGLFPTTSAGFGIKQFEISFLNQDGTPDVQAGSHPYGMVTNIVFNTQVVPIDPSSYQVYVALPQGNAKDVSVHLPPGLYGDPNAIAQKCTPVQLNNSGGLNDACPAASELGSLEAEYKKGLALDPAVSGSRALSIEPPPGVAFQIAAHILVPNVMIDVGVPAGGDSGLTATAEGIPVTVPVFRSTLMVFGIPPIGATKPLLTLPTACNGPLTSTISADSYQDAGHFATASTTTPGMTDCAPLVFPPTIQTTPDVSNASSSSGLTANVHISQKAGQNPDGLAESALRDTTVTLPAGVSINPANANGLEACSEGLAGFTGFTAFNPNFEPGNQTPTFTPELPNPLQPGTNFCPDGSKIGTVTLKTPLLEHELTGAMYLAAQNANPFGSLIAMYMVIEDPVSGTLIKLTGKVSLCENAGQVLDGVTCKGPGQIVTTFKNTPQLPFEDLEVHFFGGERAPLTTPSRCGTYTTKATFTPWDGNGPVNTTSSFQIEHGPHGGPCPGANLPFNPSLAAGTTNIQAGAFSPFTMTMSREDGEQGLQGISLRMPPGLLGMLSSVKLCGETEANAGTCGPESAIGETTVSVGAGSEPFTVKGGKVYITGPYKGAPFGLSIVTPAKAGPFDLGTVIVRAKIDVDRHTSVLTVTTDPLPTMLKGIPLQIKRVNATIDRPGFTFNPTNCSGMQLTGTFSGEEGASSSSTVPFRVANCANLPFKPSFKASTQAKTSKAKGASLLVKVGSGAGQANIAKTRIVFPKQLPARLTTLQKACTDKVFNADPSACPAASAIGTAVARTPVLKSPLTGPVYLVSHGGVAFPDAVIVLQGEGITLYLDGNTNIKKGITTSTFNSVPDAPITSFEVKLPEGPHSAFATNIPAQAKGSMCGQSLKLPTVLTGQDGAVLTQTTKIAVTGCVKKTAKKTSSTHHRKGKARKKA